MIKVFPDIEELNRFAAEKFVEIGNEAIGRRDKFSVALSGGSTPKSLYRLLVTDKFKDKIDWSKIFFFFGDERYVPSDDENSNFRMASEILFTPLNISPENIFSWNTGFADALSTAVDYTWSIEDFFKVKAPDLPRFDLILLGMGADGHTASLFPFTEALNDKGLIATVNQVEKLNAERLTLTFPVINNARNVIFLISGAEKAEALREVLQGEFQPDKFPAQNVKLNDGNLLWLIDGNAARLLQ